MALTDTIQEFLDIECSSGTGHTIRDGGSHINLVVLNKKAFSPFLAAHDAWLDGKKRPLRAIALLCDACIRGERGPFWAIGKDKDGGSIYRVPVCELADWVFEEIKR